MPGFLQYLIEALSHFSQCRAISDFGLIVEYETKHDED